MDPATLLDRTEFHLTPTRTRCDLVVFSRDGKVEKLASGLLEPFISHLKAAEEQISKGGYSIKLQLPAATDANASWFTKGTLESFVRFVKTPEILERVVTIEREISQIEDSIRCNELSMSTDLIPKPSSTRQTEDNIKGADANNGKGADSVKSKPESNGDDSGHGENSKIQLLRVLETRKAVLRKEQGMSYAQASAAGFEIDSIDDLISFSDAFGASRLREACNNFKELCKRKHDAGLWLDELPTVTNSSQSVLSYMGVPTVLLTSQSSLSQNDVTPALVSDASQRKSESDCSAASMVTDIHGNQTSSNFGQDNVPQRSAHDQVPPAMGLNPQSQFLYNIQNPGVPSPFPYPGYIVPGMQIMPPYYPGYSGTAPHQYENPISSQFPEQDYGKHHTPCSIKQKTVNGKGHRSSGSTLGSQDEYSDQDDSSSGDEADASLHHETVSKSSSAGKVGSRKSGKKSSRVVVIRNINYVTSRKRGESKNGVEDDYSSEDDFIDGDSLEQNVEDAVESVKRHHKTIHQNHRKRGDKSTSNDIKNSDDSVSITESATIEKPSGDGHVQAWDAFQNLLLREDESSSIKIVDHDGSGDLGTPYKQVIIDAGDEHCMVKKTDVEAVPGNATFQPETKGAAKRLVADDSFIMGERDVNSISASPKENLEVEAGYCKTVKLNKTVDEELMLSERTLASNNGQVAISDFPQELSVVNHQRRTDVSMNVPEGVVGKKEEDSGSFGYTSVIVENHLQEGKAEEKNLRDDSYIIVSTREIVDDKPNIQWKTDIYVDEGITSETGMGGSSDHDLSRAGLSTKYEPDDLFMIVDRNNGAELHRESWTPEIDYNIETSGYGANKIPSCPERSGPVDDNMPTPNSSRVNSQCKKEAETRSSSKDVRSTVTRGYLRNTKPEIGTRKVKPFNKDAIQKAKKDKEEEERKRVEELLLERQQRISQRSATSLNKVVKPNQGITSKSIKTFSGEQRNNKPLPNSSITMSASKVARKGYGVAVKV